jgi:hypothetical protein
MQAPSHALWYQRAVSRMHGEPRTVADVVVACLEQQGVEYVFGGPGVSGRKFTVCPSAFDFAGLASAGDQKGYQKSVLFRPVKPRPFSRVYADHLRFPF